MVRGKQLEGGSEEEEGRTDEGESERNSTYL